VSFKFKINEKQPGLLSKVFRSSWRKCWLSFKEIANAR